MQIQQHSRWVTERLVELFLWGLTLQTLGDGLFLAHACAVNKCTNLSYDVFIFFLFAHIFILQHNIYSSSEIKKHLSLNA